MISGLCGELVAARPRANVRQLCGLQNARPAPLRRKYYGALRNSNRYGPCEEESITDAMIHRDPLGVQRTSSRVSRSCRASRQEHQQTREAKGLTINCKLVNILLEASMSEMVDSNAETHADRAFIHGTECASQPIFANCRGILILIFLFLSSVKQVIFFKYTSKRQIQKDYY